MRSRCALAFLLLVATTLAAGCGTRTNGSPPEAAMPSNAVNSPTPAPETEPVKVVIDNFAFSPREITVAPGTRVTWVNRDDVPHTATSSVKPRVFDSRALDTDDTFSFVFTAPGTYDYFCAVHPHMTGKVIVK
jgi:plastocyanin